MLFILFITPAATDIEDESSWGYLVLGNFGTAARRKISYAFSKSVFDETSFTTFKTMESGRLQNGDVNGGVEGQTQGLVTLGVSLLLL